MANPIGSNVVVGPTEEQPTHHISLTDNEGNTLGLTLCDDNGQVVKSLKNQFTKRPYDTTAQKQTSGTSSYNDYEYPYAPIVQDDMSGGRGNLDFERDSTKFYDSFRARTGRQNKAYAGPLEKYATGLRDAKQSIPGSVSWHKLYGTQRYLYIRFDPAASFDAELIWLLLRRKATPEDLTIELRSDSAGDVGSVLDSITVEYTRLNDTLMEWLCDAGITYTVVSGTYYWLVVYADADDTEDNHWLVAMKNSTGTTYISETYDSTPTAYTKDLYYRLTPGDTDLTCVPFTYKEAQYFIINATSGAPSLYIAGDRGTADSNSGTLTKVKDATKSWTTNIWAGAIVKVINGTGYNEPIPYRTIVSNIGTELVCDSAWTIEHDTTTEYVIYGTHMTEITGHGLTAPVTDVLVNRYGTILFAQGDSVYIRRAKFETSAGVWTPSYANDGTNYAKFLAYEPQNDRIYKANDRDGSSNTSVDYATPADYADHTYSGSAKNVGDKFVKITGMVVYPDIEGNEALLVYKEDIPWVVPPSGNPYPINIEEMKTLRNSNNGKNAITHNVYQYFPLGYGLEQYYSGSINDVGPNQGEGMPEERRGPISYMIGYPGKFFISIDGGSTGYSSVLESGGWHERYRAPYGQRITAMAFQVIPGDTPNRLWVYQGNELVYLPFPSDGVNELEDSNYEYAPEFAVTLSRMHSGLFDVMKIVRKLKLQTSALEVDEDTNEPICWFELDYRLNDSTDWITVEDIFTESPTQEIDFVDPPNDLGLAGKRLQFRLRGYTTDNSKTPVFLAIIISAVLRTDVKYQYGPFTVRCMDMEPHLNGEGQDELSATEKQAWLENWADATTDSMLLIKSKSRLLDGKVVFLNTPDFRQVAFADEEDNPFKKDIIIGTISLQEA